MNNIAANLNKFILDALFPYHCLVCGKENDWICRTCLTKIQICTEHFCGICEKVITPDGRTCMACKRKSPLDALIPAVSYSDFCVSHAVHLFKYRFVNDLHIPLAQLMIIALQKTDIPLPDLIIPVPLHPRRMRWRGFNQSYLLANYIAKNLLPQRELNICQEILSRKKYTSPQMKIKDYKGRKQNIAGAFQISNLQSVKDKTILLVDDVTTTGSTIVECAKVLKAAGASEVYAAVIARQETKKNAN